MSLHLAIKYFVLIQTPFKSLVFFLSVPCREQMFVNIHGFDFLTDLFGISQNVSDLIRFM